MRFTLPILIACIALAAPPLAASAGARASRDSLAESRTLVRWAGELLADTTIESRQRAIRDLNRAIELNPNDAESWRLLGRAHELGGFGHLARTFYGTSVQLDGSDPATWTEYGYSWKRDWLQTLDATSLDSAVTAFAAAARLRPRAVDGWLGLVPLMYEKGDLAGAEAAAAKGLAGYPRRPEALLAVAYLAYRTGDTQRADSAFRAAMPRLDRSLRALFERPAWIGLTVGSGQLGTETSTWAGYDPDPTTRENELELEYASRVAHAFLLFADPLRPELDARAETYVRYGPPARMLLNPFGMATIVQYELPDRRRKAVRTGHDMVMPSFPVHSQVWSYPQFGMRIVLQDRSLSGHYAPMMTKDYDVASRPDPGLLAARGDLVSLGEGMAVFPTRPPLGQRLDVRAAVSRFVGEGSERLVVHVQAPGSPADSLTARWMVLDSTGREVARGAGPLGLSACDPAERRVGEFSRELPPGVFEVVVSARDAHRRRGVVRTSVEVTAPPAGLALSDIVLSCGDPTPLAGVSEVRLEANMDAEASGTRPLVAYFEVAHLARGPGGRARFEYEYEVRPFPEPPVHKKAGAPAALLSARREEEHEGALRRQFVSVPTQGLPAGSYRLIVRVRDLVDGAVAEGAVEFTHQR